MAALAKIRHRLGAARESILGLRIEYKGRGNRAAIDRIIQGLEGLMDYADHAFDDLRANAAAAHWSARPTAADVEQWREAFEEWARERGAPDHELAWDGHAFPDARVNLLWGGWRAAMVSRAIPRARQAEQQRSTP